MQLGLYLEDKLTGLLIIYIHQKNVELYLDTTPSPQIQQLLPKIGFVKILPLDSMDLIITDSGLDIIVQNDLKEKGLNLRLV